MASVTTKFFAELRHSTTEEKQLLFNAIPAIAKIPFISGHSAFIMEAQNPVYLQKAGVLFGAKFNQDAHRNCLILIMSAAFKE